jgi:hypothetical protein
VAEAGTLKQGADFVGELCHVAIPSRVAAGEAHSVSACTRERGFPRVVGPDRRESRHARGMTEHELKRGDRVEWNYRGRTVAGRVQRKLTAPAEIGGRRANASKEDPRYVVKSDKSGKEAAHRGAVLRKLG